MREADLSRLPSRAFVPGGGRERAAQDVSGQGRRSGDHRQLTRTRDMLRSCPTPIADRNRASPIMAHRGVA
ncbi:hypothetical protein GCM10023263_40650 [Phytohabitans rumicis]